MRCTNCLILVIIFFPSFCRVCHSQNKSWPESLQGAWELRIDWQTKYGEERRQLNNPTTYKILVADTHFFLYHKALNQLLAYKLLDFDKSEDGTEAYFCYSLLENERSIFEISPSEFVFVSKKNYPLTGFKMQRIDEAELKSELSEILKTSALFLDNSKFVYNGKIIEQLQNDVPAGQIRHLDPPATKVEGRRLSETIVFKGDLEQAGSLAKIVQEN